MSVVPSFTTPSEALREMIAAGAKFTVQRRDDTLTMSFSYQVAAGGGAQRCRVILAAVKSKTAPFFEAFRAAVQTGRDAA